jgi:hypothetical protein
LAGRAQLVRIAIVHLIVDDATLTQPVVTINLNSRWLVQAGTELMRPENRFTQIATKTERLTPGVHHGS